MNTIMTPNHLISTTINGVVATEQDVRDALDRIEAMKRQCQFAARTPRVNPTYGYLLLSPALVDRINHQRLSFSTTDYIAVWCDGTVGYDPEATALRMPFVQEFVAGPNPRD